jgi:hypothetical protein
MRTYRTAGNDKFWRFDNRPSHRIEGLSHGKVLPMEQPGFFARLFGKRP